MPFSRHRIQQDRDRPRFFYLIASGAGEEKEIDLNIEESLWYAEKACRKDALTK
jgi:hypothetical protein